MPFDRAWFVRWQRLLLGLLGTPLVGRWFRWVLRIRPGDVGHRRRIIELLPHAYIVANADGTRTMDVRMHPKFGKRLRYAFAPLWWLLHAWDLRIANPLAPAWNVGFDTLPSVYPDAGDPGVTTCDGYTRRNGVNEAFATIANGVGVAASASVPNFYTYLHASATLNQFDDLLRSILSFDTSALPGLPAAGPTAVTLSVWGEAKSNGLGSPDMHIVGATPALKTTVAAADYQTVGTTSFGSVPYASFDATDTAYTAIPLNATGRATVSTSGVTTFGVTSNWDIARSFGGTWASLVASFIRCSSADRLGLTSDPKLDITYPSDTTLVASIGGVRRETSIVKASLRIDDVINDRPNTCTFLARGFTPAVGQDIQLGLRNFTSTALLFAGTIQTVEQTYLAERIAEVAWSVTCQDYAALLNRQLVTKRYTATSATTIAQGIVSGFTSGFTSSVQASLASVSIDFDSVDVGTALTQLATLVSGYWYVDYSKVVHFFLTDVTTPPDSLIASLDTLMLDPPVAVASDISQIRTRVYVQGGGTEAVANVSAGATTLPVRDSSFFASSGTVKSGPQIISYTGISTIGATPGSPSVTLASGVGRLSGSYRWQVTFANAVGETIGGSLAGPLTCPDVTPPVGGAFASIAGAGLGPLIGAYGYVFTFVTALGETTSSSSGPTLRTASAQSGVSCGASATGVGPLIGVYQYKVGLVTAYGENLGSSSGTFTCSAISPNAPSSTGSKSGTSIAYSWKMTLIDANGVESAMGSSVSDTMTTWSLSFSTGSVGTGVARWRLYRTIANGSVYKLLGEAAVGNSITDNNFADANLGSPGPTSGLLGNQVAVSSIGTGVTGTLARRLYRTKAGGSTYFLVAEIADNTTTTYADTTPDSSLTVSPPLQALSGEAHTVNTIPTGPTGTLGRKVYRSRSGGSQYFLLATLPDNTTTSYADSTPDSGLGAGVPLSNTAGSSSVTLSAIPTGPTGVTQRKIYRGLFPNPCTLIDTINDNTTTTYLDDGSKGGGGQLAPVVSTIGSMLTGVTGILYPILQGDAVQLWVQRDDTTAQTALAALEGGDGIHAYLVVDTALLSVTACNARGDAELTVFKSPIKTLTYCSHDPKSRSGRTVTVNLAAPTSITGDFLIQHVTIEQIDVSPNLAPRYNVTASSMLFSVIDLMRVVDLPKASGKAQG